MGNILAHGIRMQKNPQTRTKIFWIFTDFHGVMLVQVKVQLAPPHVNLMNVVANSEIVYLKK